MITAQQAILTAYPHGRLPKNLKFCVPEEDQDLAVSILNKARNQISVRLTGIQFDWMMEGRVAYGLLASDKRDVYIGLLAVVDLEEKVHTVDARCFGIISRNAKRLADDCLKELITEVASVLLEKLDLSI